MSASPDKSGDDPRSSEKFPIQDELSIPKPAPIPHKVPQDPSISTVNAQFNYNVNLPAVQLPSWEELSKYPQDIRDFLMRAAGKEQDARHVWINAEQVHRHQYDNRRLSGTFDRQKTGQILAAILSCFCISAGVLIMILNKNPWGFVAILGGIVPLVGMAIYAKNPPAKSHEEIQDAQDGQTRQSGEEAPLQS